MPVPRVVARFQRRFVNPVVRHLATRLPGYGVLTHTGRKSGRTYRTPVNVFRAGDGFAIVIAYGRESDWLRNILAAEGGSVVRRGRRYAISNPRIVAGAEALRSVPLYGRLILRGTRSADVLLVDAASA